MTEHERIIISYIDGSLSELELKELNAWLRSSPENMRYFTDAVLLDSQIATSARVVYEQRATLAFTHRNMLPSPRKSWRSLAAGIVLGVLFASIYWLLNAPQVIATEYRLHSLFDGSFEKSLGRLPSGLPRNMGIWSGDEADVITPEFGIADGRNALRFLRGGSDAAFTNGPANACDVFQFVDLNSSGAFSENTTLELTSKVLDNRPSEGEPLRFWCRLYVFTGNPDDIQSDWPNSRREAIASSTALLISTGGTVKWQNLSTKLILPPQSSYALVQLVVERQKKEESTAKFEHQFVDDVRLIRTSHPDLPVRIGVSDKKQK